ncbi:MAG TPA: hypothetical protein VLJ19_02035 [Variovorax sp.]|nr:hypothetical protein [Variovorax sp.]
MNYREAARAAWPFAALGGLVLGSALQLQQALLWPWPGYAVLLGTGLLGLSAIIALRARWIRFVLAFALLCGAGLGVGLAGVRACAFVALVQHPVNRFNY